MGGEEIEVIVGELASSACEVAQLCDAAGLCPPPLSWRVLLDPLCSKLCHVHSRAYVHPLEPPR